MQTIKKYANGRLYDTDNKKYLTKEQLAKLISKNKRVKIVLSKTGRDITKKTVAELKPSQKSGKRVAYSPEKLKKWVNDRIDSRIDRLSGAMNLPQKDQIAKLTKDLKKLARKVEKLEKLQARKIAQLEKIQVQQLADIEQSRLQQLDELEKDYESRLEDIQAQMIIEQPRA